MNPYITIIYVYFNTPREILDSLSSLDQAIEKIPYEVIIVDNASDKVIPNFKKRPEVKIIRNKQNFGYGKAMNQGAKVARGEYLLLMNPDTIFQKHAISELFKRIKNDSSIGVIGPMQLDKNKKVIQSYNSIPLLPDALFVFSFINKIWPSNPFSRKYWMHSLDTSKENEVGFIGGAAMMIKKNIFKRVRGFDEIFFMYFEEVDLCYRIKKLGYKILYYPNSKVIHHVGRSSQDKVWIKKTFEESRYKFLKKYHGVILASLAESFLRLTSLSVTNLLHNKK